MRGARAFLLVSTVVFAACDSEVVQIGTGGMGTTSANSTVTNATVTSNTATSTTQQATTTVGTTGPSTGSFMSGDCTAACTKIEACGAPAGQCQQNIDCNQPQGACLADCINDPNIDCMEIFQAFQNQSGPFYDCAQTCQGTMSTGTGTMTTGSGTQMQCQNCGQQMCQQAGFQCFQMAGQAECQAWISCANACMDAACLDDCTTMHPGGAPIENCICTSCSNQCGAVCN